MGKGTIEFLGHLVFFVFACPEEKSFWVENSLSSSCLCFVATVSVFDWRRAFRSIVTFANTWPWWLGIVCQGVESTATPLDVRAMGPPVVSLAYAHLDRCARPLHRLVAS